LGDGHKPATLTQRLHRRSGSGSPPMTSAVAGCAV